MCFSVAVNVSVLDGLVFLKGDLLVGELNENSVTPIKIQEISC